MSENAVAAVPNEAFVAAWTVLLGYHDSFKVRRALEAAAPFIRAQVVREVAAHFRSLGESYGEWWNDAVAQEIEAVFGR